LALNDKYIILYLNIVANTFIAVLMDYCHVFVDPAHLTGWESCPAKQRFTVGRHNSHFKNTNVNSHVPTAAKITVYCFFSLGTAVKLEKI